MAVDGINKCTPSQKAVGTPCVSARLSLNVVQNEQADAVQDRRTFLARHTVFPGTNEDRDKNIFPV